MAKSPRSSRSRGKRVPRKIDPTPRVVHPDAAGIDIRPFELVSAGHSHGAAAKAVELIKAGKAEMLMKGSLHTDELLREITRRRPGCGPPGASATSS